MSPDTCCDESCTVCFFRQKRGLETDVCPRLRVWCDECRAHVQVQAIKAVHIRVNGARRVDGRLNCRHVEREGSGTRAWVTTEATLALIAAANRLRREGA
jgi:hypothetical protein